MKKFTRILLVVCVVIWVLACAGSYVFLFISALLDLSLGTLFSVSLVLVIGSVLVLLPTIGLLKALLKPRYNSDPIIITNFGVLGPSFVLCCIPFTLIEPYLDEGLGLMILLFLLFLSWMFFSWVADEWIKEKKNGR